MKETERTPTSETGIASLSMEDKGEREKQTEVPLRSN